MTTTKNISTTSSGENNLFYKEKNRMLIWSFCDIFNSEQIKENFKLLHFNCVEAVISIRCSTIGRERRMVHRMSKKAKGLKTSVDNYAVKH